MVSTHEGGIDDLEDLRRHLQIAIQLEHATLAPYFCALYSIIPGTNEESVDVLTSVFVEEMLHLTLAANVLNAIGGAPVLDDPSFVARYPTTLPHSDESFTVPLARFSPATVQTFMRVERPEDDGAPVESDRYETIGQFYRSIEEGLINLCATLGEDLVFCGDPEHQVTDEVVRYGGSGRLIEVSDLATALTAINEIEEQGEGLKHAEVWDGDRDMFHHDRDEVAHYFRLDQIVRGRLYRRGDTPQGGPTGDTFVVDWDSVYPMRDNLRMDDFDEGSPVRVKMHDFNRVWCDMLAMLHRGLNGEPTLVSDAVSTMFELRDLARDLMQTPTGDGVTTAGPTFEYVAPLVADVAGPSLVISVRENGPYVVEGGVTLTRKSTLVSDAGESLSWRKDSTVPTNGSYRLCRCGQSSNKPFCDATHARVGFDGTETATTEPSAQRRLRFEGQGISLSDDRSLCSRAAFCHNQREDVWGLMEHTDDGTVRAQVMHMVEQCPSGRLVYEVDELPVEPDLPREIAVIKDGPYWVSGEVTVVLSDGRILELRNRVTLCRCGQSSNKPLCDGTHRLNDFRD